MKRLQGLGNGKSLNKNLVNDYNTKKIKKKNLGYGFSLNTKFMNEDKM